MIRTIAACVAVAALAACAKPSDTRTTATAPGSGSVGYVRMDELVKRHPLYAQLAQYDRSIEAIDLARAVPKAVVADARTRAEEADLRKQLNAAADRTQKLLADKQKQYQAEENRAIAEALRGAGGGAPSAAQIAGNLNTTAAGQRSGATAQALRDLQSYRSQLQRQDTAQLDAAQKALVSRADRTYRAKSDELSSKESALSLRLASEDAATRLSLRTRLSSLALDDAARDDVQKQLTALDRKEADALAALRNRDQQTLATLQGELRAGVQRDMAAEAGKIRGRSLALFSERQRQLAGQAGAGGGAAVIVPPAAGRSAQANPALPADLRARIEKLHGDYQKRFQDDAKKTVADFEKTRGDLSKRYALIHGVDVDAQRDAQSQAVQLRKKRDDLYTQITAQIGREVRLIAQQRGVAVVLSDVVAPVSGIDLTPDALKDIESLHE